MPARWRAPSVTQNVISLAVMLALVLAYALVTRGAVLVLLALAAPCAALWVLRRPGNGYLAAVVVALVIPDWYAHVWLVAPALVLLGSVAGVARTRPHLIDVVLLALLLVLLASWLFHRQLHVSTKVFVEGMLPLCFYLYSRLFITERLLPRLRWILLGAGAAGALTVLLEAAHGSVVFESPTQYEWTATATTIFRAGGIFGGSPAAATCLAMLLLASLALWRTRSRLARVALIVMVVAIVVTFDRAGLLALAAGVTLFAVLLPYRRWGRVLLVALILSIPAYIATSSNTLGGLSASRLVREGVIRSTTITARFQLLTLATGALHESAPALLFGHGFDAMEGPPGPVAASFAARPLLVQSGGANDQYLTSLLEEGMLGLALVVLWLGGSVILGARTARRLPKSSDRRALVAGLTAAVFGLLVAMAGHDMLHNLTVTSVGALVTGILISVCLLSGTQSPTAGRLRHVE